MEGWPGAKEMATYRWRNVTTDYEVVCSVCLEAAPWFSAHGARHGMVPRRRERDDLLRAVHSFWPGLRRSRVTDIEVH